jgi:histidyl-tRNA synthetase
VAVGETEQPTLLRLAHALRARGLSVLYALKPAGVARQFKDADARGARHVIVLGPDEVAAGAAVVRVMASGEERRVPFERLVAGDLGP